MDRKQLSADKQAWFPNLRDENHYISSEEDGAYNCIAHAADKNDSPWWPVEEGTEGVFWPEGVPRVRRIDAFMAAYATLDYVECSTPDEEEGFEKIAIYVDAEGLPTHTAKQVSGGAWTSKLGNWWEDIVHDKLEDLESKEEPEKGYGKAVRYMKRPKRQPQAEHASTQQQGQTEAKSDSSNSPPS